MGAIYLIDRLGGEESGREAWKEERPGQAPPVGANVETLGAYFDANREAEETWKWAMKRALSRGELSGEEAKGRGFWSPGVGAHNWNPEGTQWEQLPELLYHVTTNALGVQENGLKTRRELSQERGLGLGGGDNDTISFTADKGIAEAIKAALLEMHDVAGDKLGVAALLDAAAVGAGAKKPFLAEMMHAWDKNWKPGDKLPSGVNAILQGRRIERGKLGQAPDMEHKWTALKMEDEKQVWVGGDGKTYANYYEREALEEERREDRVEIFKRFAAFREWAGGSMDPLFFSSDSKALAEMDKEQIQVLQVKTTPGAQGYRMGAMGEWRTASGEAVVVQGALRSGKVEALSTMDIWAVEAEGLELEEDEMWSGEGKSWMVMGEIESARLKLLSAEKDKAVPAGINCPGHEDEEISKVVRAVGDKWEAAFNLWREIDPQSDVPSCRNLVGRGEDGDWRPPEAVRRMLELDDDGNATSRTTWVSAPYEMLGAGQDRFAVALCEEHVLKVDPYWMNSTTNEVRVWREASEKLKERLCPVLANGAEGYYGWLVMPRCSEIGAVLDAKMQKAVNEVLGLGDVHEYNLGRLNGRVVILDYGTEDESGSVVLESEADEERLLGLD